MSSRLTAAALICFFNSGMENTKQSPAFVRHKRPTSVCVSGIDGSTDVFSWAGVLSVFDGLFSKLFAMFGGTTHENRANDMRRTRTPSSAVNLYLTTLLLLFCSGSE